MAKKNRDYRKKWYKGQQKTRAGGAGGAEVRLRPTLQPSHIMVINLMDLEELPSIIKEAWRKENVLL